MNIRKLVLGLVVITTIVSLFAVGCAPQAAPEVPAAEEEASAEAPAAEAPTEGQVPESGQIVFLLPNVSTPFFTVMVEGAQKTASEYGWEVTFQNADNDPNLQATQFEDAIAKGVDGIIVTPVDKDAAETFAAAAREKGIVVVAADRGMDGVDSFVQADNYGMGVLAAEEMVALLTAKYGEPKGKIAELQGRAGNQAAIDRNAGFIDGLKDYPDIEIVAAQDTQFDTEKGFQAAQNILTANPDLDGFYSHSDAIAQGAVRAVEALGLLKEVGEEGHIIQVCINGDNWAMQALRDGYLDADMAQAPTEIGAIAAAQIFKVLKGEPVEAVVSIPPVVVRKSNADDSDLWGNKL